FLNRAISFTSIPRVIKSTLAAHKPIEYPTLDEVIDAAGWASSYARSLAGGRAAR
ncbi:MAG: 1-deoxy-D-xylulose-5-phosphate reductoisomerase, partial [Chloroflexi bacterium]|nr:1-deoxy-D-xylulose-5-phosphate reductoisomerase [Chloroflexota bacterium]